MERPSTSQRSSSFVVVGAGIFGASTALELVKAGHHVTVLERSHDGYAAPDAASNDINKIIRPDYSDPFYRSLARRAISAWRQSTLLAPFYHEVGVLFHTGISEDGPASRAYVDDAVRLAREPSLHDVARPGHRLPQPAHHIEADGDALRHCFAPALHHRVGQLALDVGSERTHAYFSSRAGWGEADRATRAVLDEARNLGAHIVSQACATELIFNGKGPRRKVIGVRMSDGRDFLASGALGSVVLCAGAWTNQLLTNLLTAQQSNTSVDRTLPFWPSAQCVIALQLTEEQRQAFKHLPVVLDFASGFYFFEPDDNGVMKIAIHSGGYQYPLPSAQTSAPDSFPTFKDSNVPNDSKHNAASSSSMQKEATIPADKVGQMLDSIGHAFPELKTAPIVYTRVCFYSESHDENWIIDHVPDVDGLVVASGDSGHAFKFLPTIGAYVCARIGLTDCVPPLTPYEARVWSFAHHAQLHKEAQSRLSHQRDSGHFKGRL